MESCTVKAVKKTLLYITFFIYMYNCNDSNEKKYSGFNLENFFLSMKSMNITGKNYFAIKICMAISLKICMYIYLCHVMLCYVTPFGKIATSTL